MIFLERRAPMFEKIDHIGIAVKDMKQALGIYETVYGLNAAKIETIERINTQIAFIPLGEVLIELLAPTSPGQGRIGEHLDEKGEGLHHIAYRVKDIDATVEKFKTLGVPFREPEVRAGGAGSRIIFIEAGYANNVLTELVEREEEVTVSPE